MLNIKERIALYQKAIEHWGIAAQEGMFIEEIGEVLTAMNKRNRVTNGCSNDDFLNELVDLDIMLEQMHVIYQEYDWDLKKDRKLLRLKELLSHN